MSDGTMQCPKCGAENRAGANYCHKCRAAIGGTGGAPAAPQQTQAQAVQQAQAQAQHKPQAQEQKPQTQSEGVPCPNCKGLNRAGAKFCRHCRKPLTAVGPEAAGKIEYIGLEEVRKKLGNELANIKDASAGAEGKSHNKRILVFQGDHGTGKTTVAEAFTAELQQAGYLEMREIKPKRARVIKNDLVKLDLNPDEEGITKYIQDYKINALIIENAVEDDDFLHEMIQALYYGEDHNCFSVLVGAKEEFEGYWQQPKGKGDKTLVSNIINFPPQSNEELAAILKKKLEQEKYTLDESAVPLLLDFVTERRNNPSDDDQENGWIVERVCKRDIINAHKTLWEQNESKPEDQYRITEADIPLKEKPARKLTKEEIFNELDSMIGLAAVKTAVRALATNIEIEKEDAALQEGEEDYEPPAAHIVFTGNPGTGKTTVARVLGKLFKAIGLLPTDKIVETDRAGMVGQYQGETAQKTEARIQEAMGGILLVDEAYTLAGKDGQQDPYGKEAVEILLKRMEDNRGKFTVIAAGYKDEMTAFINSNTGLQSRFNYYIHLDDYKPDELFAIYESMLKKKKVTLDEEAKARAIEAIETIHRKKDKKFANGRTMRELFEKTMLKRSTRIAALPADQRTPEVRSLIVADDIPFEETATLSVDQVMAELNAMTGLTAVKAEMKKLASVIKMQVKMAEKGLGGKDQAVHYMFTGNPGTGKTTVARMMGKLFKAMGLLPEDKVIEVVGMELKGQYVGDTAPKVNAKIDQAMGGILFLDEAYSLKGDDNSFGTEAITTLLARMENDRGKFVCIAAGYPKDMDAWVQTNSGLPSRFTKTLNLEDYNPTELFEIFGKIAKEENRILTPESGEIAMAALTDMYNRRGRDWANARSAREFFNSIVRNQGNRIMELSEEEQDKVEVLQTILPQDIPYEKPPELTAEQVLEELNAMTGLESVKADMKKLTNAIKMQLEIEQETGAKGSGQSVHYIFTGNPGTGKTTVARMMGKLFKAMGLLPSDKFIEITGVALKGQYTGDTAPKVNKICDDAQGGVLFIDEAYSLKGDDNSFGKEAVDTLLTRLENDRGKFVCIAAGYTKEMADWVQTNPGLPSRFTTKLELEDYNPDELFEIFSKNVAKENCKLTEESGKLAMSAIKEMYGRRNRDWANARTMREFLNDIIRRQRDRIAGLDKEERKKEGVYQTILPEDIPFEVPKEISAEEILADLNSMTGLTEVKEALAGIVADLKGAQKRRKPGEDAVAASPVHFLFIGNPGTGKTTVARKMGKLFKAMGLLPSDRVEEVSRADMVGNFIGDTAKIVNKVCDRAMGGTLFIDEAYLLTPPGSANDFGVEAVGTLLQRMENDRGKFIVIAAGYKKEMGDFLASNSGLADRFTHTINLADYKPDELYEIFTKMAAEDDIAMDEGAHEAAKKALTAMYDKRDKKFGNARAVRKLYEAARRNIGTRVGKLPQAEQTDEAWSLLKAEDITGDGGAAPAAPETTPEPAGPVDPKKIAALAKLKAEKKI